MAVKDFKTTTFSLSPASEVMEQFTFQRFRVQDGVLQVIAGTCRMATAGSSAYQTYPAGSYIGLQTGWRLDALSFSRDAAGTPTTITAIVTGYAELEEIR